MLLKSRRILLPMLAAMLLLALPLGLSAQDDDENELIFELSETFTVSDLQFEFPYPAGWVFDTSNGISLAQNEADLAVLIDDDDTTTPEGYTIELAGAPLEALGLEDPTLDNVVEFLVQAQSISVDETVEVPILTRRSITVIGVNDVGRAGLATIWLQNGFVVVLSMGTPLDFIDGDTGFTWGNVIGGAASLPIEGYEITENYPLPAYGVEVAHPTGWFAVESEDGVTFYELESDAELDGTDAIPEGYAFALVFTTVDDLGLGEEVTYENLFDIAPLIFPEAEVLSLDEHVVLDVPGVAAVGQTEDQATVGAIFLNEVSGTVLLFGVNAPDVESLQTIQSTAIAFLQTLRFEEE